MRETPCQSGGPRCEPRKNERERARLRGTNLRGTAYRFDKTNVYKRMKRNIDGTFPSADAIPRDRFHYLAII